MTGEVSPGTWREVLDALDDEPPALEVSDALASETAIAEADAYDHVSQAIDDGVLVEHGEGFGYVVLAAEYRAEDTPETPNSDESEAEDTDISTETPTRDTVEPADEDAVDALDDAIAYFNSKLDARIADHTDGGDHTDRPTTARDYFAARGWDDETIDEMRLGWAPASRTGLLDHLMKQGHGREAIIGTGLFTDDLAPLWQGRYVLPYFDGEGRPVYAIARCTGSKGGGGVGYDGHPEDGLAGKYAKLRHTDDRVPFDEPIWGHHTLEEGEPVVVAEGVADAITATEAGYSVLSPVAKEFKKEHYDPLLEAIERFDVPRVTVVPDSERAGFDAVDRDTDADRIREHVSIPAASPGMGGALRTADHLGDELEDADTSVHVADLPLPATSEDFHKVDLDDYLHDWADGLDAVLASAKPPEAYPEYEAATASRSTTAEADDTDDSGAEHVGDAESGLWDLDLDDLENIKDGERTKNPFAHTGDSEKYFVGYRQSGGDIIAKDYKGTGDGVTYNALTGLLVDAGKRSRDDPEGSLSDAEVFHAWKQAKKRRDLGDGDPVPYRGLLGIAVEDGLLERDDLVDRDADEGDVVEDPDEYDGDTYTAFPPGVYADVLEHVEEEHDVDPGREVPEYDGGDEPDDEEYRTDPRHVEATVDPRRAWDAAGRVKPPEVGGDLPTTDDGEAFASPSGEAVDVVRAVAIAEGVVDTAEEPLEDEYPEAYRLAREAYGAPLPEYYTTADAIAEFDAVLDLIGEVTFWDLDADALGSEITEECDEVGGEAVRALNPSWRESESEASVLVFPNGKIWDADTERSIDAQRFVALDSGLIDEPTDAVAGGDFTEAYRRLRDEYGAPLPRWDPATDSGRDITPQLPPSEEVLAEGDLDGVDPDALEAAREEVEALIDDATTDAGDPTVVTALPATGKTTGTVKTARERPLSYLAPRKELQAQALRKADRWDVDAEICPVFADERVREDVLAAAVSHVRDYGKSRLRDRWAILSAAFGDLEEDDEAPDVGKIFTEDDEDGEEVDLDRPTCETAEGKHGVAWALAVHVARRLGYTPREIHTEAGGLFGAELPCSCGESECEYTEGWDVVGDADHPPDLLVGSYVHAHVESVRTKYDRGPDGERQKRPRAVVLDEFVGEAFTREFGPEALDFATWLATALREDVADRRDMIDADLYGDEWVRSWLDGEGGDAPAVEDVLDTLARTGELYDARDEADAILGEVEPDTLDELGLRDPLEALVDGSDDPAAVFRDLRAAIGAVDPNHPRRGVARWVDEEVAEPLAKATVEGASTPSLEAIGTDAVPFGGDLEAIVSGAVEAARTGEDTAREAIAAATTALRGGREGCRRLAAWADDGYAHPDAHHLLRGVITPTDEDSDDPGARRIHTDAWAFDPDATEGTVLDVVETTGKARTVVDRNDHGALLHTPPARTAGNGDEVPLVGLDATGRRELWANALGEEVTVADIHDTPAERAEFLLEALDLRVIQAADRPRYYEGDPTTKDTDGDVALLEAIADEYAGIDAPRQRGEAAETVGKPAAITTKGVRGLLEDDPRLDDDVDAWENFGNVTGANDLGNHRLAAILGCQHYGDHAIERFCAIAGREVDTSREGGRGAALGYDDEVADAYLKHMTEDQTMQAILRFARGDSGATVVARTAALREDLPVAGDAQVVETWSDTATALAREYRRLGDEFTAADVRDAVDVGPRQVRRVLAELVDAGYIHRVDSGAGIASTYEPVDEPGSGEVDLPDRGDAVDAAASPGRSSTNEYYTWNVRVSGLNDRREAAPSGGAAPNARAPPAPTAVDGVEPPG